MKKHHYTTHHQLPVSRGGSSQPENLVRLKEHVHVALHTLFDNGTPVEQIERLLFVNSTCLREEFKARVRTALDKGDEYVYNDRVLIKK